MGSVGETLVGEVIIAILAASISGMILYAARRLFWRLEKLLSPPILIFVSTGGTCRDPMAKVIMDRLAQERGAKLKVYAAGVGKGHSRSAAKAAKIVVKEATGSDLLGNHRTRHLTERLATKADLILGMEEYHASEVRKLFPSAAGKTHSLANFLGTKRGIGNPYGQPDEVDPRALQRYRTCFRQIEKALISNAEKIFMALGITESKLSGSDYRELG